MGIWIEPNDDKEHAIGDTGYLVRTRDFRARPVREYYRMFPSPGITNQSHKPLTVGWLGSINDVSRTAIGRAVVVRVAANGRALVHRLDK